MKHRIGFNRLGRKPAHRKAMLRNMVTSLFSSEYIRTTKAKARSARRIAEKMVTRARVDTVHNRRMIARDITNKAVLAKLFTDIAPRYRERPGGYTRMLKLGPRYGDAAEMVILEFVGRAAALTASSNTPPSKEKEKEKEQESAQGQESAKTRQ